MLLSNAENEVVDCVTEWKDLLDNDDRIKAKNLLLEKLRIYKSEFQRIEPGVDPERRNKFLITTILYRGLLDYMELLETFPESDWCKKPKCIEEAWVQLCNSKDRIRFVSQFLEDETFKKTIEWILKSIEYIEQNIEKKIGKGQYMSIDATAEKKICSICGNDIRACSHIEGKIYDGNICITKPLNLRGIGVALVENPADPRCRIWPWNTKDKGDVLENECVVLTYFSVDDFMYE